jgi:Tfp pilus assembly protein PilZ
MEHSRARTSIPVEFEADDLRGSGKIKNVSAQGLFVTTSDVPAEGDTVRLSFAPPGEPRIALVGLVWWTTLSAPDRAKRAPGFGLRLIDDSEAYDRVVTRLLS